MVGKNSESASNPPNKEAGSKAADVKLHGIINAYANKFFERRQESYVLVTEYELAVYVGGVRPHSPA